MKNSNSNDDSELMMGLLPSAPLVANPMLAAVLNFLGIVEIIAFCVLLIMSVWINEDIIRKLLSSDLIAFVFTLIIYWLLCYKKKEAVHCG